MTAKILASATVAYAQRQGYAITNLKLQKTLYYVQGYYIKTYDEPLFRDLIEHWPYGPVVPSVYFEYSVYGAEAIEADENDTDFEGLGAKEKRLVKKVIDKCLTFSAGDLVEKTHKEDPWQNTKRSEIIAYEAIEKFFKKNDPLELCG